METLNSGQFKKGFIPWNAGTAKKHYCKTCGSEYDNGSYKRTYCSHECRLNGEWGKINRGLNKGRKHKAETKNKMSKNANRMYKTDNPNWVGDEVKYAGLHNWIRRNYGRPSKCEFCDTKELKTYHWANISGEYKRDIGDFIELCPACHFLFDNRKD